MPTMVVLTIWLLVFSPFVVTFLLFLKNRKSSSEMKEDYVVWKDPDRHIHSIRVKCPVCSKVSEHYVYIVATKLVQLTPASNVRLLSCGYCTATLIPVLKTVPEVQQQMKEVEADLKKEEELREKAEKYNKKHLYS